MVGAGGADANADADATSSRFGGSNEEDANATPSGTESNLPRRRTAALSRDGDDKPDCHHTVAWAGFSAGLSWAGKQASEARGRQADRQGKQDRLILFATFWGRAARQGVARLAVRYLVGGMAAGVRRGQGRYVEDGRQGRRKANKGTRAGGREPGFWKDEPR
ncbi:hypothetical protein F5Y03DRAFT_323737 [Xylaria venustula]|nr:hypothetical protein F5Y03DRAFT_323737 [Xylaria venustula]